MDDILTKLAVGLLILGALIFDWPRALAGGVLGVLARRSGRFWVIAPPGVAMIAALGELLYGLVGHPESPGLSGFGTGLLTAGVAAIGLSRMMAWLIDDVEAAR